MIKKRIIKHLIIIFSLILMCNSLSYFATASDEVIPDKDLIPVCDYVLVCMEHDYSFPDKDYEPSYFGEEYVERVEAILTYTDGCLADKDEFCRIEKLYLTEFGQDNIDLFIEQLNARPDILCAERDYKTMQAFMDDVQANAVPKDAVPIDDYILVCMEHDYSFPDKDYEPSYFGEEYVKRVEAILTYTEGCLANKEDFYRVEKLYLTEFGKEHLIELINNLTKREDILIAEQDYNCKNTYSMVVPNDTFFSSQYALTKIMSQKAWAITKGTVRIKIGIVDSGITSSHPDLISNINATLSHNCVSGENDLSDIVGHGTIVAGIAAARGNNGMGVSGVAWYASIVNLRVGAASGGDVSNDSVTNAVNYAINNNIPILNMSIGNLVYNEALRNAINSYSGLCVVAAGNNGTSTIPYPANYNLSNMIVVAATDENDDLASFSCYHSSKVHLAAPGKEIYTTVSPDTYSNFEMDGTSLSAPQVTGTLALMKVANPNLTSNQLKTKLLDAVDPISGLSGKVSTGGRLNTFRAVRLAKGYLMGDSNLDGVIDTSDARQVLRWAIDLDNYTNLNEALCDVNYDNAITTSDAQLILQMAIGSIDPIQ